MRRALVAIAVSALVLSLGCTTIHDATGEPAKDAGEADVGSDTADTADTAVDVAPADADATADIPPDEPGTTDADVIPDPGCVPDCTGKDCGGDGCGGICGTCTPPAGCLAGVCELDPGCTPDCEGKVCGGDGCDGSCGECVYPDDLNAGEQEKVAILRVAFQQGLDVGHSEYVDAVSTAAQGFGLGGYGGPGVPGFSGLGKELSSCPFLQHYGEGFELPNATCAKVLDAAKAALYAKLTQILADHPLPPDITSGPWGVAAGDLYQDAIVTSILATRAQVRWHAKETGLCDQTPSPLTSSLDKGVLGGMQYFGAHLNGWLATYGYTADYPQLTDDVNLCNIFETLLSYAYQDALDGLDVLEEAGPCGSLYKPPPDMEAEYEQAASLYVDGVKDGVDGEYALSMVALFAEVTCSFGP